MSEEFKYLSFESQNSEIKDLINSGNIYKMRQGLSGLLLPAGIDDGLLENERDRKYLKELYPQRISEINGYIEDECDKLEYEGSPMFAEYPDREVVRGIARDIYNKLDVDDDDWAYSDGEMSQSESMADSGTDVSVDMASGPDYDMEASASWHHGRNPGYPGGYPRYPEHNDPPYVRRRRGCVDCPLRQIIEALLCSEFYCRRERYRNRRRRFY